MDESDFSDDQQLELKNALISLEISDVMQNIKGDDKESQKIVSENYSKYTSKELNQMLDEAVNNEDYEKAGAKIVDSAKEVFENSDMIIIGII